MELHLEMVDPGSIPGGPPENGDHSSTVEHSFIDPCRHYKQLWA